MTTSKKPTAGKAAPVLPFRQLVGYMQGWNGLTAKVEICPVAEKGFKSRRNCKIIIIMKKVLMTLMALVILIASGQAQEKLKVGEMKNGKLVITNPDALKAVLFYSLGKSGTLGKEYKVSVAPESDRFFVFYPVSGNKDKVTSIGVVLVRSKNEVLIIENPPEIDSAAPGGGGSATITCTGAPCASCEADVSWPSGNWYPVVSCVCNDPEGQCNMSISFSVNIQFGG
jgi:hypothetical protein